MTCASEVLIFCRICLITALSDLDISQKISRILLVIPKQNDFRCPCRLTSLIISSTQTASVQEQYDSHQPLPGLYPEGISGLHQGQAVCQSSGFAPGCHVRQWVTEIHRAWTGG